MTGLHLLFFAGVWWSMGLDKTAFAFDLPLGIKYLLLLPIVASGFSLGLPLALLGAWRKRIWTLAGQLFYTFVTITAPSMIEFLWYWNLLGWQA